MTPRGSQPTRKKILVWSRDRSQHKDLIEWLSSSGYDVIVYPDVHDVVAVCAAELPDLIVLSGRDAGLIDRLEEDQKFRRTPVLLLSECDEPPTGIAVSRACITDWLPTPLRVDELIMKVKAVLRVAYAESLTTEPAERDGLTKLYNRRYFDERLDREIERARRYGRDLTCVMMDVDDYKEMGERYGHRACDRVLSALADLLLSGTRCSDIIARYGAQELSLLLPETAGSDARIMAERLRKAFAERTFECGESVFSCSVSCGVAGYPDHARDAETLIRMADSAVFQAKSDGGNTTFVAFTEEGPPRAEAPQDGPTILIVEANDYSRSVASLVLRSSGYEVLEACDGATALTIVRDLHPDLILIDLQLNGSEGLSATKKLVGMEENRDVPIVALTARDVPVDLDELVKAGCRGYIVKPIDTNNLALQVRSYLDG